MFNPIPFWVFLSALLKKMDDHRRRFISEEEYRRIQAETDAKAGRQKSITRSNKIR